MSKRESKLFKVQVTPNEERPYYSIMTSGAEDFLVDWGDGTSTNIGNPNPTYTKHLYSRFVPTVVSFSGRVQVLRLKGDMLDTLTAVLTPISDSVTGLSSLSYLFAQCERIRMLPNKFLGGAFSTMLDFSNFARGCFSLEDIPADLFSGCVSAADFSCAFQGTKISSIPPKLFKNCPDVRNFSMTFNSCSDLLAIPSKLFDPCQSVTSFYGTFYKCLKVSGNAPKLWDRGPVPDGRCCFCGDVLLKNFHRIPISWKEDEPT